MHCKSYLSSLLSKSFPFRNGEDSFTFESGERLPLSGVPMPFRPFFTTVSTLRSSFSSVIDWENSYFPALLALVIYNNSGKSLSISFYLPYLPSSSIYRIFSSESVIAPLDNRGALDHTQSTIVNALKDVCTTTGTGNANRLSKIVSQVYCRDQKDNQYVMIQVERVEVCVSMGEDILKTIPLSTPLPPFMDSLRMTRLYTLPHHLDTLVENIPITSHHSFPPFM